jgi:soluble lytic murein transglycosylase-like protein
MDYDLVYDEFEYEVTEDDGYFDASEAADVDASPLYPDPLLIASATCVLCLILFGLLTKLSFYVFRSVPAGNQTKQTNSKPASENKSPQPFDGECAVSSQFPPNITRWCNLITQYSLKHNLDPDLTAAVIWLESGGNEQAYSHSGAVGLMQIMPRDGLAASFMCANGPCFQDRPSTNELRDPENNIAFGTRYLSSLINKSGNLREALKSYGPLDAGYSYSDKVLSIFNRYKNN